RHGPRRAARRSLPAAAAAPPAGAGEGRPGGRRAGPGRNGVVMRSRLVLHAVDSHSEGMPTRVITGGVGTIPGATMAERRAHFRQHLDRLRTLLMYEP